MSRGGTACVLILGLAASGMPAAQPGRRTKGGSFDYYVLALSWAPAFCAQAGAAAANQEECAPGHDTGFVVHGLWPQAGAGTNPEFCGKASRVPKSVINYVIRYMPSPSLIQHEWAAHGVCTGLTAAEYFGAIIETRAAVQIPVQFGAIEKETRETPGQIETQFAAANPGFPPGAFRTSCPRGELQEERICFDKDRKPRACTASAGECRGAEVVIRPPL